jgi:tRNA pseudouridine(38-40) synthase
MPRYKLIIEYDGTPFSGWQIQDTALTVQGALETAVKAMCGEAVRVNGAGRTDAGVHALAQVAHCDIAKSFVPGRFRDGLNAHLRPHPIAVLSADIVAGDFPRASGTTFIASSTPAPISRSTSAGPGGCRAVSMRRRCIRPRNG